MNAQSITPARVMTTVTHEGTVIQATEHPDAPLMRVKEGVRDSARLAPHVLRERGVILEVLVAGHGWQEIHCHTFIRFLKEDDGKVGTMTMTASGKREAHASLIQRAEFELFGMIEDSVWG